MRNDESTTRSKIDPQVIQKRMEELRRNLDKDVEEIAEGIQEWSEWRSYVRAHPWVCTGLAFAAGYFLVPKSLLKRKSNGAIHAKQEIPSETNHSQVKPQTSSMVLGFIGNLAMRVALSYAEQRINAALSSKSPPTKADES